MEDADIFDQAITARGGRLDLSKLAAATAEGLEYEASRAKGFLQSAAIVLPHLPPIHFDFIDNWDFNAVAFREQGRYFIGVHRGAMATLSVLFDRMLADPRILEFIGNPAEEVADLPLLPDLGPDFSRSVASVPTFPPPRNPSRLCFAKKLTETAFDFLVAHEFVHIASGHLDYLDATTGLSVIDELGMPPGSVEQALISQTIEMDADAGAVLISLGSEWGHVVGRNPIPGPQWQDHYSFPGQVCLLWSYAVSSLCRIFGDTRLNADDMALENYPSWRLRSVMIQQMTGCVPRPEAMGSHPSVIGDNVFNIPATIKVAQHDVERLFSLITGQVEETEGLNDAWGDPGTWQINRLRECWRSKLKDDLTQFAYQPLTVYSAAG